MTRLLGVARLHTVTWQGPAVWPWLICALAFLVNWAVYASIADVIDGDMTTGGLASLFVVSLIMFASAVTQVFPYALGLGVTRRLFCWQWSSRSSTPSCSTRSCRSSRRPVAGGPTCATSAWLATAPVRSSSTPC